MNYKTRVEQPDSVSDAFDELLNKMYISNVHNRLRQLNEPSENDCKRWIWELIQNAKDSISNDEDRKTVDIRITVKDNEVSFSHNGSPFTAKAQLGLLYKYSEGKVNDTESTGRFGTGFLTTHSLSKVVSIEGDVFKKDNSLIGFSAVMYRDGLDETELLEGVLKMKSSMLYTKETNDWTTFTYHLRTPQNENALRLGLSNFLSNIAQTMLFCKELNSVELDNNGSITNIFRRDVINLEDDIKISEFEMRGESTTIRRFLHKTLNKSNDRLSDRFKTDRKLRLTASVEIDLNKNIVESLESPSHYCVLPLVGSESHVMPIYLNSPDFEPDSERESLLLIGEDVIIDKNVISDGGINRMILKESIELYDSLVSFLSNNGYHNLYLLGKGLKKIPKVEKNFNGDWFKEEIIDPYRNVLKKYSIVETEFGNQKLFLDDGSHNILIPKDSSSEIQNGIYKLLQEYGLSKKLPLESVYSKWSMLAWKECGLFRVADLCKFVEEKGSVDNLEISDNKFDWLNKFLSFISEVDEGMLKEYKLIPNMNGDFVSLDNESFAEGVEITDYMISILNDLGEDLRPNLLNSNITSIKINVKIDSKSIASKINNQIKKLIDNPNFSIKEKIARSLPLLNTVPTDIAKYKGSFLEKQEYLNMLSNTVFDDIDISRVNNNDIPENAYNALHEWLISVLISSVSEYGSLESLPESIEYKIEWLNRFIFFIAKEVNVEVLDKSKIIPNQKGVFRAKDNLARDMGVPEELKSDRAENFGIKLKDGLLHKGITSINIANEININSVISIIDEIHKNKNFADGDDHLGFSIFLAHFLPEESSQLLYKSQKSLLDIVRKYYYQSSSKYEIQTINCSVEEFWRLSNDEISRMLSVHIEQKENIVNLKEFLSNSGNEFDDGDTIILLNDYYDYLERSSKKISRKIVPNQNGNFCYLDDSFFKDDNIPEELKDILFLLDPKSDFRNILSENSLSIHPTHNKKIDDIAKLIDESIKRLYSSQINWSDEHFIKAVEQLMMNWFPRRKYESKDIFPYSYRNRDSIEMNILWSLEERQRMQRAKSIDPELLERFIINNEELSLLEKEKEELKSELEELKDKVSENSSNNSASEIIAEFPNLTIDKIRELLRLEERTKEWNGQLGYVAPDEEQRKRNFENGYKGEAYVYKMLLDNPNFRNVNWEHKTNETGEYEIIDFQGDRHNVRDKGGPYDLTAETLDGDKVFIEVKSTRTSLEQADNIAIPISTNEWRFVDKINSDERHYLARVFDVENEPKGHYLSMMGVELNSNL